MPAVADPLEKDVWIHRVAAWDLQKADEEIRRGLSVDLVVHLQKLLDLTDAEAAQLIGRSRSTYVRYRTSKKELGVTEAERAVRYARLVALAAETFGSLGEARAWMLEHNYALGGERPIELAETDPGASIVRDLLTGMQHGFSL
jgi:putative toxin-antitoxin system antitoxin component (TIGR02293 family)